MSNAIVRKPEIWLIGGYGDVGLRTATHLSYLNSIQIVIAGRDSEKAQAAVRLLGGSARGVEFDVTAKGSADALSNAGIVVNFVEKCPVDLVTTYIGGGGRFIETSADPGYLQRIADAVASLAKPTARNGLVVLSTGTSPGLTNILARKICQKLPQTTMIDICIEMSLGRHYGQAAAEWFLRNLSGTYPAKIPGRWRYLKPGALSRRVHFVSDRRDVPAVGYGFSDQADIARALDLPTVRTFVALAPSTATQLLRLTLKTGLGAKISRRARLFSRWMKLTPTLGAVRTRVSVEGFDVLHREIGKVQVVSTDQSEITAVMTATVAHAAMTSTLSGLIHSDQLVTADTALAKLIGDVPGTSVFWFANGVTAGPSKYTNGKTARDGH